MPFRKIRSLALSLVVPSFIISKPAGSQLSQAQITQRVDSVMNALMAMDLSPGAGIVVVRDTQVVYMKGFGFADVAAKRPFTPETEMYIASTTKSFTGLAASILDKKGTFKLDRTLHSYLPALTLKSPLNADSITIRSLLTHTHGIGNNGPVTLRLAYTGEYKDDADLVKWLEMHDAAQSGRTFSYGNIGYNVAALAMDAATKKSWKDVLQSELFTPLGMKHTSAYVSKFKHNDLATPYQLTLAGWAERPYGKTDATMQSAGGLITTLRDEATWLEANVNNGKIRGKQILPASAFIEAHRILAPFSRKSQAGEQIGYGFGWNIYRMGDDTVLIHGGGFPGFATNMSIAPARKIGIVVFANNDALGPALVDIATGLVYQAVTDGGIKAPFAVEQLPSMLKQGRDGMMADLQRRASRPQQLQFPLSAYAGVYENPVMGKLRLDEVNGKLEAHLGAAWSAIEVFDNTKNLLRIALFGNGEVVTVTMADGKATALTFGGNEYKRVN